MIRKTMFPTDFSLASNNIYDCIPTFKTLGLEEAVLVHIVDERDDHDVLQRTSWAEDELARYQKMYEDEGINVKTIVRLGVPFVELKNIADEEDVSLVIMTSHGKSMVEKMLLGSVTMNFLYHSKRPLLIEKVLVFEDYERSETRDVICKNTFKHVLFPTDWSGCANDVFESIKTFNKYGTEEITVLHVMDERILRRQTEEDIKELEEDDRKRLDDVKNQLNELGYKVNTELVHGSPFKEIKRKARDSEITMIAMGVHGKGYVKEMLIGSTAERAVKFAFKPVLLLSHLAK